MGEVYHNIAFVVPSRVVVVVEDEEEEEENKKEDGADGGCPSASLGVVFPTPAQWACVSRMYGCDLQLEKS